MKKTLFFGIFLVIGNSLNGMQGQSAEPIDPRTLIPVLAALQFISSAPQPTQDAQKQHLNALKEQQQAVQTKQPRNSKHTSNKHNGKRIGQPRRGF